MTTVLEEPFDDLSEWDSQLNATIIAGGRTGNGLQVSSNGSLRYDLQNASDWVTLGVAFKASLTANRAAVGLLADAASVVQVTLVVLTTGAIEVRRGTSTGALLGTTVTGLVTGDTWTYLEWQSRMHDTAGESRVRVNNTQVLNLTAVDTRAAGTTGTVFSHVRLATASGATHLYDDMYVAVGAGESFRGDIHIGAGPSAKVWNGSAYIDGPVRTYNGSAFVDAVAVKTWNGSAFV